MAPQQTASPSQQGGAPLTEGHKEDHMELHIKGKVVSIHDKMEVLDEND